MKPLPVEFLPAPRIAPRWSQDAPGTVSGPRPVPGDRVLATVPGTGPRWGWCMFADSERAALNLGFGKVAWVGLGDILEIDRT